MEIFPSLFGNEKIKNTLALDILSEKSSHAYILEGSDGSGKHSAALSVAAAMFCERRGDSELKKFPCGECPACKKVFSGECADIVTVRREGTATIGVDAVRRHVKSSLHYAPTEMSHKIFIIEDADKMTPQAQNALLIPMEEAPPFVVFILLCRDAMSLLETVRSRAPVMRMEIFSNDTVKKYLMSSAPLRKYLDRPGTADEAAGLSGGTIGRAIEFLMSPEADEGKTRAKCMEAVKVFCTGSTGDKIAHLEKFPEQRTELLAFLGNMKAALRDILCVKKSDNARLLFYTDKKEPLEISSRVSTRRLCELWDLFTSAESDINANVGISAVLTLLCTK